MCKWHAVGGNIVVVGWVVGDVAAVRRIVVPVVVFYGQPTGHDDRTVHRFEQTWALL